MFELMQRNYLVSFTFLLLRYFFRNEEKGERERERRRLIPYLPLPVNEV